MKTGCRTRYAGFSLFLTLVLSACAGQSTDPHQGGLFGYNPAAYEQRIRDRQQQLAQVEQENKTMQENASRLTAEKSAQQKKIAALEKQLATLRASTASLEKKVQRLAAENTAQKKEQKRILSEIAAVKSSLANSDDVADPEEKRLELERLKKKRDQLEKEAEELMLL